MGSTATSCHPTQINHLTKSPAIKFNQLFRQVPKFVVIHHIPVCSSLGEAGAAPQLFKLCTQSPNTRSNS
uniref:Uncharacterized protein n=1 Tax=Arundo donax TaxID=35708 RepID=A0A0A9GZQ2_ARUDO